MYCSNAIALMDAIPGTTEGADRTRATDKYLYHVKNCKVCQDHYARIVGWAKEKHGTDVEGKKVVENT